MFLRVKNEETGEWEDVKVIRGDTPVKGVDYFTEEDKQTLLDELYARIINGNEVAW